MRCIILLSLSLFIGCASTSQMKSGDDGSAFVCRVLEKNNLISDCVKTAEVPSSDQFREVPLDKILPGNVIWWKEYMGIIDLKNRVILCSKGKIPIKPMIQIHGKPRFFLPKTNNQKE